MRFVRSKIRRILWAQGLGRHSPADLAAIWQGRKTDDFAEAVVISTAALALDTLGVADPEATAAHAWAARHDTPAQPEFTP